jgi:hypothetical protein
MQRIYTVVRDYTLTVQCIKFQRQRIHENRPEIPATFVNNKQKAMNQWVSFAAYPQAAEVLQFSSV